jgi:hypothetical protein
MPAADGPRVFAFSSGRARHGVGLAVRGAVRQVRSDECRRVCRPSETLVETNLTRLTADRGTFQTRVIRSCKTLTGRDFSGHQHASFSPAPHN